MVLLLVSMPWCNKQPKRKCRISAILMQLSWFLLLRYIRPTEEGHVLSGLFDVMMSCQNHLDGGLRFANKSSGCFDRSISFLDGPRAESIYVASTTTNVALFLLFLPHMSTSSGNVSAVDS